MKITEIVDDDPTSAGNDSSQGEGHSLIDEYVKKVGELLKQRGALSQVSKDFAACESDVNRVKQVRCLQEVTQVLQLPVQHANSCKSEERAVRCRNEGNAEFKRKRYAAALRLYGDSIQYAPVQSQADASPEATDSTLALAYANRSAVLFHLKRYEDCLADIKRAFDNNYPKELHYKLYDRQARSLRALKRHLEAGEVYARLNESLTHAQLDEDKRKQWKHDCDKGMMNWAAHGMKGNAGQAKSETNSTRSTKPPPRLGANPNPHFPSLSRRCDVTYAEDSGRYIEAKEEIGAGEVLMVEQPYASVLLPELYGSLCHVCYTRCDVMITCAQCTHARYCSDTCRQTAESSFHKYECGTLGDIHASGLGKFGHLSLRAITIKGPQFYREFMTKQHKPSKDPRFNGCGKDDIYRADDYNAIYHLVGHSSQRTPGDLFRRTLGALYLLKCLKQTSFFDDVDNESTETGDVTMESFVTYVGSLLLRHMQSFPCNAHEISELQLDKESIAESVSEEVGAGIYSTLSLFNHSCDPLATRHFYGDTCVVRSIRPAKVGDEVSDNYGTVFAVQNAEEREQTLSPQYYFKCACVACKTKWPLYPDIPHQNPTWICSECYRDLPNGAEKCSGCIVSVDLGQKRHKFTLATEKYEFGLRKLLRGDISEAMSAFCKALNLYHGNVKLPWRDVNNCQEGLKQCLSILGNCHELPSPSKS